MCSLNGSVVRRGMLDQTLRADQSMSLPYSSHQMSHPDLMFEAD